MAQRFVLIETTTGRQFSPSTIYMASNRLRVMNGIYAEDASDATKHANLVPTGLTWRKVGAFANDVEIVLPTDPPGLIQATIQGVGGTLAYLHDIPDNPLKAWVNFDGTTAANVSGTYIRNGGSTTVTVTLSSHGYIVGNLVQADFTTGTALDGLYPVISVLNANEFTITTVASTATSGNVTFLRRLIRASSGVHSVTYRNSVGLNIVNLSELQSDANYAVFANAGSTGSANPQHAGIHQGAAPTTAAFYLSTANATPALANQEYVSAQVIR